MNIARSFNGPVARCRLAGAMPGVLRAAIAALALTVWTVGSAYAAQLGAIVGPGPLSKAHAALEGVGKCVQCHEPGRVPTSSRCLRCHKPIAERIALKKGVHRNVTDDCVRCHVEHKGAEADLRRLDPQAFDHAGETGFALEGRHAALARTCSACHKQRSFLDVKAVCAACHADAHKTNLGADCTRCHSTAVPFKETRAQFDHTRAQFELTGAHRTVACQKCHVNGVFRGLRFDMCSACHQEPHRQKFGPTCTSCHTPERWATRTVEHSRTGFTLVGMHAQVACTKCHTAGMTKPLRFDRCSACHTNVHRESVKEDCRACHTEAGFRNARFDHGAQTRFALVGKHDGLPCRKCHTSLATDEVPLARKVIDFGGMKTECVACHADQHKGEYGPTCDACHRPTLPFKMSGFKHPRTPEFFGGRHATVVCAGCHVRPTALQPARAAGPAGVAKPPSMACGTCHADVHLGQVGPSCERCHEIDAAKFAPARFSHENSAFPLTGKHESVECIKCHPPETRAFPAGTGTAKRLNPMPNECKACHKDPHLGQVQPECRTCHVTATFKVTTFAHREQSTLFTGFHGRLPCQGCHKTETGEFPAGRGTAVRFKVGATCRACHDQF